jgi:hypothetical protein
MLCRPVDSADAHLTRLHFAVSRVVQREAVVALTKGRLDGFALLTRTFGTRERIL